MNSEPLLNYEPPELSFQSEQNKELLSYIPLVNNTNNYVAFKLKSTNPRNYVVQPRIGILLPRSTCEIQVRVAREASNNTRRKDKFMIQSAVAAATTTLEDVRKLFDKDSGHPFQQSILRVVYSRSRESSPATPVVENADPPAPEADNSVVEPPDNGLQVTSPAAEPHDNDLRVTEFVAQPQADVSGQQGLDDNIYRNVISILRGFISNCTCELVIREIIGCLLISLSLYLMERTISWIRSLVMFVMMLVIKMIKKLVSDSVEDWIVKTLVHIVMFVLFGRNATTQS